MKTIITLCFLFVALQCYSQTFYSELYGFKIGQFRESVKNELGNPFQYGKYDDGFVYEAFSLKPDKSLIIIFEYSVVDTNKIWSIQVSGNNPSIEIGIKSSKMGLTKTQIENIFGIPSLLADIGEYGFRWIYDKSNFSLEVNKDGKLSSIKILNNSVDLFGKGDLSKIPSFEFIKNKLCSKNNSQILELLTGDFQLYKGTQLLMFSNSSRFERDNTDSKILKVLKSLCEELKSINPKNVNQYEENMRMTFGEDQKHVIKLKKGTILNEIVFKYFGGQFLICEISTKY